MALNFTFDKHCRVKVLYDYNYVDEHDNSSVEMREGEIFYLLNSDVPDWWEVCRPDSPSKHFYAPSTYVEVLTDVGSSSSEDYSSQPNENQNRMSTFKTFNVIAKTNDQSLKEMQTDAVLSDTKLATMESDPSLGSDDEGDYMNVPQKDTQSNESSIKVQYRGTFNRPKDLPVGSTGEIEGEYANLEDFRKQSGLPPLQNSSTPSPQATEESHYANLSNLDLLPKVEQGRFLKSLKDSWDQYMDPETNRMFYVHKDAQKVQWRPPRGEYHRELENKRKGSNSPGKSPSTDGENPSPGFFVPSSEDPGMAGGHQRNLSTGSGAAFISSLKSGPRVTGSKPPQVQPKRLEKARSVMIENLHLTGPGGGPSMINYGPVPPKSATLPSSFTAPDVQAVHIEGSGIRSSNESLNSAHAYSVNINDPIEGNLNKSKVVNGRKSKKWSQVYAKLVGDSNLVFFKDARSAQPKKDGSIGKHEQIVPLAVCSIHKDKDQLLTSKKNTFVLTNPDDGHILLQAESEAQMQEWFLKLRQRIAELGGNPETPTGEPEPASPELQKSPSNTTLTGTNGTIERKGKIRTRLERLVKDRSEKEKLVKRGIYKDAVFGSELKIICQKEKSKVPTFVTRSIEAIEKRGLHHEGIYRVSGNMATIQKLRCMVDAGEKYDLDHVQWDTNILAGALKLFFRELKDPLFTCALFDKFLKSYLKELASDRLKAIKSTMEELPKVNYETAKVLFKHLLNVMDLQKQNKMAAHQLAIVFGPTLIWPEEVAHNLATSMVYQSMIVEFILLEYANIFR